MIRAKPQGMREVAALKRKNQLRKDERGDAVVEAAILLPIMMMIYLGLILLAMYLPTRALLQRATQYTATATATERSDTWLRYDQENMKYEWVTNKSSLENVYAAMFHSFSSKQDKSKVQNIVAKMEAKEGIQGRAGTLEVRCNVVNWVIYKEIQVTATRTIPSPINLSFVGFPKELSITVTSSATVQNGDEFVRNVDIVADAVVWGAEKLNLTESIDKMGELMKKFNDFLGI